MEIYQIKRFLKRVFPQPTQPAIPLASTTTYINPELGNWYSPILLGAGTIGEMAMRANCLRQVMAILDRLEPDKYVNYLQAYYQAGLERFGDAWRYADIVTVLLTAAQMAQPSNYLEIGVRRGRSMAVVAVTCPECHIVGFDLWKADYAGIPNPGSDFVRKEMAKINHRGRLDLISGNSHETIPRYFNQYPESYFDLITVDGDHTEKGSEQDLRAVTARLKVGGILVFDDICHPTLPYLINVWRRVMKQSSLFDTWEFTELGYGVALAVRKG